ncbi:cysteine desulfurase family protein [Robertmurraya korlensis]|uniref:cysteine desulfurase family protein n=1 Tax=Robertmurraya korlensis TaxID=519977 RepID=UPI003F75F2F1
MTTVMKEQFGNPSSIHSYGRAARHIVDESRTIIAKSIGAKPEEIVFTSGGTESDNLAIVGIAKSYHHKGNHIITTMIEHHAVLHACKSLEKEGFEVTYLPVDETGQISMEDFKKALRDETILVTIMYGNNEVGAIQPINEIAKILENHQAKLHTDAVQAFGLMDLDVTLLGVDLLSVSAHKINGPKGIGFLYVKQNIALTPLSFGGEQERKRRAGTENVASIAGFAKAVEIASMERTKKVNQFIEFKKLILEVLQSKNITFSVNGLLENSLPHVLNLSFPGTDVESMLVNLDMEGVAVSSGSACTAGSIDPSHVLVAMFGQKSERVRNSIRFSFGLYNTKEQVENSAEITAKIVSRLTR